jgi:AmmeMemoRadiSam system protein A
MSDQPYNNQARQVMIDTAREAVRAAVACQPSPEVTDVPGELTEPRGCFVTLHNREQLRGCIGTFEADAPLIENLIAMAGASARDPRFTDDPVQEDEVDVLSIDVSILTPREPIDDPLDYVIGQDGQYVVGKRFGSRVGGCFLPEVAAEQGWDVPTTLSMLCAHKMGLDPDAWRAPTKLQFFRFQSIKVSSNG